MVEAPASFYVEQKIPVVRWMYPNKCYYARLITVPRKHEEAKMFIYVVNEHHVIAYLDEQFTQEIALCKLADFEKIKEVTIDRKPQYISAAPIEITDYETLLVKRGAVHIIEPELITEEDIQDPVELEMEQAETAEKKKEWTQFSLF